MNMQTSEDQLILNLKESRGQEHIEVLVRLCDILYLVQPQRALGYAERAMALSDETDSKHLQILSRIQSVNCFFNLGDYGQCQILLNEIKELLIQFPDAGLELALLSLEGKQLYMEGRIREAIEILLEVDEKLAADQDKEGLIYLQAVCTCKLYVGLCWLKLKSPIKSLEAFQYGYDVAHKFEIEVHAINFKAVFSNSIGRVYMGSKEFSVSREWFDKSVNFFKDGPINSYKSISYLLTIESYVKEHNWKQAEVHANWIAQQFREKNYSNPAHHLYLNHFFATIMRQTGRANEALELIVIAQSYWEPLNSKLLEEELLLEHGLIYLALGEEEKGLDICTKVIDMVVRANNKSIAQLAHEELAAHFKTNGNFRLAIQHIESAHYLERDELAEASVVAIESLEAKHEISSQLKNAEIHRLKNIELFAKNEELEALNHELEKLLEQRSELMKIAVHDLRTPITNIQLQIFLLSHHKNRFSEEKKQSIIRSIQEASSQMTELLDRWLSSERIEQGDFETVVSQLNPLKILDSIVEHMEEFALARSVSILSVGQSTSDYILTDETYLRQILLNLISNALKYSPSNSTIYVDWYAQQDSFVFEVKDEGQGLLEQDLPKLFNKSQNLSAKPMSGEKSAGLGLHIAQKLSHVIGGRIEAESEGKNRGSLFRVVLPKVAESKRIPAALNSN